MDKIAELIADVLKAWGPWGVVAAIVVIFATLILYHWIKCSIELRKEIKLEDHRSELEINRLRTEKATNQAPAPPIHEVLAGVEQMRNELDRLKAQDERYVMVMEYIIDEHNAKGLKSIAVRCFGSVDKAVPFIEKSDSFDDFLKNGGIQLDVNENVRTGFQYPNMTGQHAFGVPTPENPSQDEMAIFTIEADRIVHMNIPAHRHFDWSYHTFKRKYHERFQTPKGIELLKESRNAASAIYEKYIAVLRSYPNCVPLIGIDDTDEKLKSRIEEYQKALVALSWEIETKEVFITQKDKLRNFREILGLIWSWVAAQETFHMRTKRSENRVITKGEADVTDKLARSIDEIDNKIHVLEPKVKRDFECLITGK